MSKFLLGRIGEDRSLTSEMSGATVSGAKLATLLEKMEEYRGHVAKLGQRGVPEGLVRALLDRGMLAGADFAEKKKVEDLAKAVPRLRRREGARSWPTRSTRAGRSRSSRRVNGVPRTARIDAEFVGGFEFKRIRETAKSIGGLPGRPLRRDAQRRDRAARDAARRRGRDLRVGQEGPR